MNQQMSAPSSIAGAERQPDYNQNNSTNVRHDATSIAASLNARTYRSCEPNMAR